MVDQKTKTKRQREAWKAPKGSEGGGKAIPVPEAFADAEVTLNHLAGQWQIHQLAGGHRFSNDDLLTAWVAAQAHPEAQKLLDIGSGIGSVGLLTLFRMSDGANLTTVEVQELSYRLATRTVAYNGLASRVELRLGDLRDPASVPEQEAFDLITGSPPYIPPGHGRVSTHPQKAAARTELNGDVFDYCRTAARALKKDGRFCFCHAAADRRPEEAIKTAGLTLRSRWNIHFQADRPPQIAIFVCGFGGERRDPPPFYNRGADGAWTNAYIQMRREMGAKFPLIKSEYKRP